MTPKISTKSPYPKKYFSENPKNIEIQSFEPQKNDPSVRMYKNIKVRPFGRRHLQK